MANSSSKVSGTPRVSITMPVYNAEAYVETAVRALMNQTFTDFELLAMDDCSSDRSAEILDRLAAEDARIQVVRLPENGGSAKANNIALGMARGEYLAYTDADDISEPQKIEKQVAFLDANPDIGLVATQYWKLNAEGSNRRKTRNALKDAALKFHLLFAVPFCHPTVMYRRKLALPFLPEAYDSQQKVAADFKFFSKLAEVCKFAVLPDYLFSYRVHSNGTSRLKKHTATEIMLGKALEKILAKMPELKDKIGEVEAFIRIQRVDEAIGASQIRAYLNGLELLRSHYVALLGDANEIKAVNYFCGELAFKTLLGRYRLFKKPHLVAYWIMQPNSQLAALRYFSSRS